jgi:hypothetical protein
MGQRDFHGMECAITARPGLLDAFRQIVENLTAAFRADCRKDFALELSIVM